MEQKPSHQNSTRFVMVGLGAILFTAGLLICAFLYFVVLKNDHSEFGGLSEGLMIMCGGFPLAFTGFIVLLVGLVMPSQKGKR